MRKTTLALMFFFAACDDGPAAPPTPLPPPPAGQGFQIGIDTVAPAHSEIWKCRIMKWPLRDYSDIHSVEHLQSSAMHHMDVMVILYSGLDKPEGEYDCKPLYEQYPKLMEETILYGAQSSHARIDLPPGVAAEVPPGLTIMYEVHYVNATNQDQKVFSRVNGWTMPAQNVTSTIWGGVVRDRNLNIPPQQDHTEWSRCTFDQDVDLLFISSHTHRLGRDVKIFKFDGQATGDQIFENDDWQSPTLTAMQPSLHIPAGQGLEFRCHYYNDEDSEVHWGFLASDEMCNMALVYTPGTTGAHCSVVQTSDGVIMP